jgi:anti-sigma factor RsiW
MITCRQLIAFIAAYVEGELDDASTIDFERHLHLCPSCRAYLATYRQTITLAAALATDEAAEDVPEELVQTILDRAHP